MLRDWASRLYFRIESLRMQLKEQVRAHQTDESQRSYQIEGDVHCMPCTNTSSRLPAPSLDALELCNLKLKTQAKGSDMTSAVSFFLWLSLSCIHIRAGATGAVGTAMAVPISQKVGPHGTSKIWEKKFRCMILYGES